MVKKIAVLTSGGDAPGMNACLRAVIRAGLYAGKDMYVIYDGLRGLVEGQIKQVNKDLHKTLLIEVAQSLEVHVFLNSNNQKSSKEPLIN